MASWHATKNEQHPLVGKDIPLDSPEQYDTRYVRVVRVEGDRALTTPVYCPEYATRYDWMDAALLADLLKVADKYHAEMASQQAAEIAAEMAAPQHLVW